MIIEEHRQYHHKCHDTSFYISVTFLRGKRVVFSYVSYCHHFSSVVRPSTFHILIFSSETTGPIATKLWWNGPWVAPFQICVRWSWLPTKMVTKLKIEKMRDEIFKKSSPLKLLSQSQPYFAEMILPKLCPAFQTKMATTAELNLT